MASGGDPPKLPRGLIGRTGTPNAKGARLPSIRGPRDLTLGGVQKKVFVPNIPARRKQSEGNVDVPSTSKDDKFGEGKGRGRGRGRGDRGRGRGERGRGREMNVIQTHSLFEQGPGGEKLLKRPGSEYTPSGGVRGTSAGARSAPKISIKIEKTDTETKEVLDMLLKDDFVDVRGEIEEDVIEQPVKLPLEIKSEVKVKAEGEDYTKVKVKSEPMDTNEDVKSDLPNISETKSDALSNKANTEEVSCADLFTQNVHSETGVLMFLQLPDTLPGLPVTTEEEFKGKKAEKKEPDKGDDLSDKLKGCNLDNFSEGLVGKLVVRKSGRVQLQLGGTYLDVNMGTPCGFLQDLVSVKTDGTSSGEATILGHVEHKLVCTPDFEMLLDST